METKEPQQEKIYTCCIRTNWPFWAGEWIPQKYKENELVKGVIDYFYEKIRDREMLESDFLYMDFSDEKFKLTNPNNEEEMDKMSDLVSKYFNAYIDEFSGETVTFKIKFHPFPIHYLIYADKVLKKNSLYDKNIHKIVYNFFMYERFHL
jgi:hypothetical protein